jgi:protein-L-isoaspartate(D-aspartate) O-methyltransferase
LNRRTLRASAVAAGLVLAVAGGSSLAAGDDFMPQRKAMIERLRQHGITKPEVLAAMQYVPRHLFVPDAVKADAYSDRPLEVGQGRTIYHPYVVALMTSLLELERGDKVLEVGTGSGYHAAVLSRIAGHVYSMEIVDPVARQAAKKLDIMGYKNITIRVGDGYQGWPDQGPFDAILLSAAPPTIPKPLLKQLKVGGKMVAPVGGFFQDLQVITKTADGIETRAIIPVRLAPMTGKVRDRDGR